MGLAIASAIAQTQSTTTSTTTGYIQSSTVVGAKIRDSRGEEVGVIKDFVLDRNTGCLAYVVLSTGKGGVLSTSTKTVAAPWAVFSASSDPKVYTTRIEREKIYSAPVWESTRVEEYSRTDYLNNVYGYYGVTAPRFNAELSVGTTNATTTGVTSSTNATAPSTTAVPPAATPAASAAVSATVKPLPSPLGTPERSPVPPTTAAPSTPKAPASTRRPAKETSSPSSTKAESRSEKTESASESPSKSSKLKKQLSTEPGSLPEAGSTPKEP